MTEQEELEYEMPDEIDFSQGRPNPYATRANGQVVSVLIESELANYFPTSAEVNQALRSVVESRKLNAA